MYTNPLNFPPEPYISDAVPTVHGESLVFRVEIGERVFGFELDAQGNVCGALPTAGDQWKQAIALEAAKKCFERCPNFLAVKKEMCGNFRAVRTDDHGFIFKYV